MYFVQMSITDILHYVIIFVYVQGQLILSVQRCWTKSKKYSSSSGAKKCDRYKSNLILS